MNRREFRTLWAETLDSPEQTVEMYGLLANKVVDVYKSGDKNFAQHVKDRFGRVAKTTGQTFDAENFDLAGARAFIADEIGFTSWDELTRFIEHPKENRYPILFRYAIAAMWRGDFTAFEQTIGGGDAFDDRVIEWYENGYFDDEQETLAEVFAAACMLGHDR